MSRESGRFSAKFFPKLIPPYSNDIPGFQNRLGESVGGIMNGHSAHHHNHLGVFFFSLALFGFSCLSSLGLFSSERILFIRERYGLAIFFVRKYLTSICICAEQTATIHRSHTSLPR